MIYFEPKEAINAWVAQQGGGRAPEGTYQAMASVDSKGALTGGIVFYDSNGKNCLANIALSQGKFPKELLRAGLLYAFTQLALRRLTFVISSANIRSQQLVSALGATHEATLREADPEGDSLIFALFPENCPIWSRFDGKKLRVRPSGP